MILWDIPSIILGGFFIINFGGFYNIILWGFFKAAFEKDFHQNKLGIFLLDFTGYSKFHFEAFLTIIFRGLLQHDFRGDFQGWIWKWFSQKD